MIRLSSLLVCASFLACAFSQSPTVTPSTTAMSSTVTPGPSPTGTPEPSPNNEYVYQDGKGVCLRMIADVVVVFDYEDGDGKVVEYSYNLTNAGAHARVDDSLSVCGDPTEFTLAFTPPERTNGGFNYLKFTFAKTSDTKAWTVPMIQFNFIVTKAEFNGSEFDGKNLTYNATTKLFNENIDLSNSYRCVANDDVMFDSSSSNDTVNVTLKVTNLQVQPYFEFTGDKKNFGSITECKADNSKGNKIVPIAVGAALAGLVIVVLIAYLIGRLKSRRQSSYEALS